MMKTAALRRTTVRSVLALRPRKVSADRAMARPARLPFAQPLEDDVEHRNEEDADGAGDQHAGEHRGADVAPADLGGALRPDQRYQAQDEGERGHHHRSEPHAWAQ